LARTVRPGHRQLQFQPVQQQQRYSRHLQRAAGRQLGDRPLGQVARNLNANEASAQASFADLAAIRLSQQSELVQNYLQLRVIDEQKRLLEATVAAYQRSLKMTENQYRAGVAGRTRWQAQTQQKHPGRPDRPDLAACAVRNAIAVLPGKAPAEFSLAESRTSRHCRSAAGCRRSCWSGARTSPPPSVR
jgi:hypothetical protein